MSRVADLSGSLSDAALTSRYDFTARCFNAETGECLCVYKGHLSFVFTLRVCAEVIDAPKSTALYHGPGTST